MIEQALTDPENQPSQWGTVPLAWYEDVKAQREKLRDALAELLSSCRAIDAAHGRQVIDPHAEASAEAALAETVS